MNILGIGRYIDTIPFLSGSLGLYNVMIGLYITNEFTICQLDIKHLAIQLEHDRGLFPMRSLHWYVNRMCPYCLWPQMPWQKLFNISLYVPAPTNIYLFGIYLGFGCVPVEGRVEIHSHCALNWLPREPKQLQQCKSIN